MQREIHFLEKLDVEFECLLCHQPLIEPMRGVCGHECCASCFNIYLNSGPRICPEPSCGRNVLLESLTLAPKTMKLMQRLQVYCSNKEQGCEWVGEWGLLHSHRSSDCQFEGQRCPFHGCNYTCARHAMPAHKEHCVFRQVQCEFCLLSIKVCHLDGHRASCDLAPMACPQHCGMIFPKIHLDEHLSNECLKSNVVCPFHEAGCDFRCIRGELNEHVEQSMSAHLQILLCALRNEREESQNQVKKLERIIDIYEKKLQTQLENVTGHDSLPVAFLSLEERLKRSVDSIERFFAGRVLIVDLAGFGDFSTIFDAIEQAIDGDMIVLRPGTYDEPVSVCKSIWLRGSTSNQVTLASNGATPLTVSATAKISEIAVLNRSPVSCGVRCQAGNPHFTNCTITSTTLSAVVVSNGAPIFDHCVVRGSKQYGFDWRSLGGSIFDCTVENCEQSNVVVSGTVVLRKCLLRDTSVNCVWVKSKGIIELNNCSLSGSGYSNVDIAENGAARIESSIIRGAKRCGICAAGKLELTNSSVISSCLPNVVLLSGADAVLENSQLLGSAQHGLVVKRNARCKQSNCTLATNCLQNVVVENGALFDAA